MFAVIFNFSSLFSIKIKYFHFDLKQTRKIKNPEKKIFALNKNLALV